MAARWRDCPPDHPESPTGGPSATAMTHRREPLGETRGAQEPPLRELPRWMRLYFYAMHGLALDVVLSSAQGFINRRDPKLVGFSSPYLCVVHSLTHFALEKIYSQKRCFRGRSVAFHLVFYPSVYIGLQILIGNISTLAEQVRVVSATQLAVHYVLALYFSLVFHRGMSTLRYHPSCTPKPTGELGARGRGHDGGAPRGLPGFVRFLFYGMQGLLDEVIFTSVCNLVEKSDRSLSGYTSPWSFLMYGTCSSAVEKLYFHLRYGRGWGTLRRLPVYIGFIYTWEFSWGLFLRQFGACSWDYSHYPHNFMGLVTLLYLPGWACLSLYQDVLSNVLLRVRCIEVIEVEENGEVNGAVESKRKKQA
ncbi:transmembrane protein 229A [Pungitius pungitius]|uniref:transmembrane protein 229A n=1 Tax=Pungitius pungitius TaxID=134920 RepID=UPI002E137929